MTSSDETSAAPTDLEWGIARGLAGYRGLALLWAVAVLAVTRADLSRPALASAGLVVVGLATAAAGAAAFRRRRWLLAPVATVGELALATVMLIADGLVYDEPHGQTYGSAWPVAAALNAGVRWGPIGGAGAGLVLGAGRTAGSHLASFHEASDLSLVSSTVLFTLAGVAAGVVSDLVRRAETTIAQARARDDVARTLHDGVLQTLAVIQRRSPDQELASLARDQELELRAFLAGDSPSHHDLSSALRDAASQVERRDGLRCEVLFVDEDHPVVSREIVLALAGAVREALTNAAKHSEATRATVFVDVDDEVFCSIKDDGAGFDPATATMGLGISESIQARIEQVGGTVDIDGRPGHGVEVRLHAPLRTSRT